MSDLTLNMVCLCLYVYRTVLYECCPGYMKLEGMKGCPAGM